MNTYVDGFVIPIPAARIEDYRAVAEKAAALWREHGALSYVECVADDINAENMISFPQLANAGPEETIVFAWIGYASREHRDEVNAKVMADPRIQEMMDQSQPIFDCARMAYGGFKAIVQA